MTNLLAQALNSFQTQQDIKDAISALEEKLPEGSNKREKLKWLGKPEQFGYLFSELARKGFIEMPSTNGEPSIAGFAKICFELFDFTKTTSESNLERALNPKKNTLSESNQAKFQIPDIADIS